MFEIQLFQSIVNVARYYLRLFTFVHSMPISIKHEDIELECFSEMNSTHFLPKNDGAKRKKYNFVTNRNFTSF